MKLMTKEIKAKMSKYPLGSQEAMAGDAHVIVKYFNAYGAGTWLITEANPLPNGDYEMFGLCYITEPEFGTIWLSQLEDLQTHGYPIERDLYLPDNCTLKQAMKVSCITEPKYLLADCHHILVDNIKWVKDSDDVYLPSSVEVVKETFNAATEEELKECISEYLEDHYGHYHKGFTLKEITK